MAKELLTFRRSLRDDASRLTRRVNTSLPKDALRPASCPSCLSRPPPSCLCIQGKPLPEGTPHWISASGRYKLNTILAPRARPEPSNKIRDRPGRSLRPTSSRGPGRWLQSQCSRGRQVWRVFFKSDGFALTPQSYQGDKSRRARLECNLREINLSLPTSSRGPSSVNTSQCPPSSVGETLRSLLSSYTCTWALHLQADLHRWLLNKYV